MVSNGMQVHSLKKFIFGCFYFPISSPLAKFTKIKTWQKFQLEPPVPEVMHSGSIECQASLQAIASVFYMHVLKHSPFRWHKINRFKSF